MVRTCAHSAVWNGVCTVCGEPVTGGEKREIVRGGRDDSKNGVFELNSGMIGRLEREAEDLLLDRPHTTKSRNDVFLLLEEEGA